ncbi:MAG TPA: hypothetical protein VF779_12935 [Pyrinomonadaceae bacterium]
MRTKLLMFTALLVCGVLNISAQQANASQGNEQRVGLEEQAIALDSVGQTALSGQLVTRALSGTPDAPVKNVRFILENRSTLFYTYVTGTVTFYDERGVRCGEGEFTLNALAPGEQAEVDAPGLRLACAPRAWRIVANNLLTRTTDVAKPKVEQSAQPVPLQPTASAPAPTSLEITVNDKVYNAPLGSTLDIPVKSKRVKITVRSSQ